MVAGMALGTIWMLQLGVLGILDKFLCKHPAPEGQKNTGPMIWGIIVLVFAGTGALYGLWGLIGVTRSLQFIGHAPVPILLGLVNVGIELALSVFLLLGGISRLRRRAPGMGVLKLIFGIVLVVSSLVSPMLFRMMF